jgi:hypothetical protein
MVITIWNISEEAMKRGMRDSNDEFRELTVYFDTCWGSHIVEVMMCTILNERRV